MFAIGVSAGVVPYEALGKTPMMTAWLMTAQWLAGVCSGLLATEAGMTSSG